VLIAKCGQPAVFASGQVYSEPKGPTARFGPARAQTRFPAEVNIPEFLHQHAKDLQIRKTKLSRKIYAKSTEQL
jgi:hypothetical protein